jgi:plasmid stability protein
VEERVATLNVKNVPETLYRRLQKRARTQHRSIAQEVTHILAEVLESRRSTSILALKGLGKEHWASIDPAGHVATERDSWD